MNYKIQNYMHENNTKEMISLRIQLHDMKLFFFLEMVCSSKSNGKYFDSVTIVPP